MTGTLNHNLRTSGIGYWFINFVSYNNVTSYISQVMPRTEMKSNGNIIREHRSKPIVYN